MKTSTQTVIIRRYIYFFVLLEMRERGMPEDKGGVDDDDSKLFYTLLDTMKLYCVLTLHISYT
jgi:hypothetical protein